MYMLRDTTSRPANECLLLEDLVQSFGLWRVCFPPCLVRPGATARARTKRRESGLP